MNAETEASLEKVWRGALGCPPRPLTRDFFAPSAAQVAPALLGQWLLRRGPRGWSGGLIVETEAYLAQDPACHGFKRETARNRSMYGPPGHAYVYFIYGNHWCFNAVYQPAGVAEAVLIRALEPAVGLDWMRTQRPVSIRHGLTNGPAKLCAALGIARSLDGADLCGAHADLMLAANEDPELVRQRLGPVVQTTRIGITQAADWPLRWYLRGSKFVSVVRASAVPLG